MSLAQPTQDQLHAPVSPASFDDAALEALLLSDLLAPDVPEAGPRTAPAMATPPQAESAQAEQPEGDDPGNNFEPLIGVTQAPAGAEPPSVTAAPATEIAAEADDPRFETTVAETAAAVGGVVMFQMQVGTGEEARWVAAVALGEDEARRIVMIELPVDGGAAVISPAEESSLPIAGIAGAYAGLAECWGAAA